MATWWLIVVFAQLAMGTRFSLRAAAGSAALLREPARQRVQGETARLLNLRAVVSSLLFSLSAVLVSAVRAEPFAYVIADEPGYGALWVIDTASNAVKGSPVSVGVGPFAIALAGTRAYVGNQNGDEVAVIDTGTRKVISRLQGPPGHRPLALAASPDGKRIYLTQDSFQAPGPDGLLSVIDAGRNRFIGRPLPLDVAAFGIATSPDGKRAYVTAGGEGSAVSVVDLVKRAVIATIPAAMKQPFGIALTPDGTRAVVTDNGGNSVWIIDTVANAAVGEPIVVAPSPKGVAVAPMADGPMWQVMRVNASQ